MIEVELDTIGGRLTNESIEVFLPRISSFERIDFATQWALAYFEEHGPRNTSRDWNLQDHGWKHDLFDLDAELRKALGTRLVGATMWLTVKNSGSVNAEDVRVELLADGGWLLASEVANLTIEVPRPPLRRIHDPNAIFMPPMPTFDFPTSHSADPSEPVWEVTETEAEWRGVSRLAVRIPILRHRDEVEIPFRLGTNEDSEAPGRLIVRVSTENTPKPVVKVFGLVRDTQELSVGAVIDVLIEREELEISVASRAR